MKKTIFITTGLASISFIAIFIYFVTGVSSVSPPIKKYQYFGSVNQLISGFEKYSSNHSALTFKITDTVGVFENGYAYYLTIKMMNNEALVKQFDSSILKPLKDEQNIQINPL